MKIDYLCCKQHINYNETKPNNNRKNERHPWSAVPRGIFSEVARRYEGRHRVCVYAAYRSAPWSSGGHLCCYQQKHLTEDRARPVFVDEGSQQRQKNPSHNSKDIPRSKEMECSRWGEKSGPTSTSKHHAYGGRTCDTMAACVSGWR